jgi:hypothetical protein
LYAPSVIFKKLPKENSRPIGENSPKLVTLSAFLLKHLSTKSVLKQTHKAPFTRTAKIGPIFAVRTSLSQSVGQSKPNRLWLLV